jgi:hypothetical protein
MVVRHFQEVPLRENLEHGELVNERRIQHGIGVVLEGEDVPPPEAPSPSPVSSRGE